MTDRKKYLKQWWKDNKERLSKQRKQHYLKDSPKNKTEILESNRQYRQTAGGIYSGIKGTLKKRDELDKLKILRDEFIDWYNSQEKICFYCKRTSEESAKDYQYKKSPPRLSIDRVNNKKGYEKGNIVLACRRCNNIKNNFFTKDEMLKIVEIFSYKFY